MIAVVGRLESGMAGTIARRIARAGATVELVATASPGSAGDRALGELAAAGIGHAAVLRSPSPMLDPRDAELALRYLPDVRVVVLAADAALLATMAADVAAWCGAALVVMTSEGDPAEVVEALDEASSVIILECPARDPDEAFTGLVAAMAVRLDAGAAPATAWRALRSALGLERVSRAR